MEKEELTPGILALIAVFSIGGLVFVGWQAELVGKATSPPYYACCSVESWRNAPVGYVQGEAVTTTQSCSGAERLVQCCARAAGQRSEYPFKVVGAKYGSCESPQENYPIMVTADGYGKV